MFHCSIPKLFSCNFSNLIKRNLSEKNMSFCSWRSEETYRDHFQPGIYVCTECGNHLFESNSKFEHGTPWPAFTQPVHSNSLKKVQEEGRARALKVYCKSCDGPLGHEFLRDGPEGPDGKKGSRF